MAQHERLGVAQVLVFGSIYLLVPFWVSMLLTHFHLPSGAILVLTHRVSPHSRPRRARRQWWSIRAPPPRLSADGNLGTWAGGLGVGAASFSVQGSLFSGSRAKNLGGGETGIGVGEKKDG